MTLLQRIDARVRASTVLIASGTLVAGLGGAGCGYWHHVGMDAGPGILLAGALATLLDLRLIGGRQALVQFGFFVAALFLPNHIH